MAATIPTSDDVKKDLIKSIQEEDVAVTTYFVRGRKAKRSGDEKTSDLYKHIRQEEEHHRDELLKRNSEVSKQKYFPEAEYDERLSAEREIKDTFERQRMSKERLIEGVDHGIRDIVRQLNDMGYITISSCSGMVADHGRKSPSESYIVFLKGDKEKNRKIEKAASKVGFSIGYGEYKPLWYHAGYEQGIKVYFSNPRDDNEIKRKWEEFKAVLEEGASNPQYSTTVVEDDPSAILKVVWVHLKCRKSKPVISLRRQHSTGLYWPEENKVTIRQDSWAKMHPAERRLVVIHETLHACGAGHQPGFRTAVDTMASLFYKKIWGEDEYWRDFIRDLEQKMQRFLSSEPPLFDEELNTVSHFLAETEGDPISKYCCRQCGECAPKELLEEGKFSERIGWLRNHYKEKHPGMWGHAPQTETQNYWVKIKDPGSSSFTKGAVIPYEEFQEERKRILERGEKPPSIEISREVPPDNGDGEKKLPATVEGEPIPEKYRTLTPLINEPLPPGVDFMLAVETREGERKIDVVLRQLQTGVESIQDSNTFRTFLTTMSKFHNYSLGNQILIAIQKPQATRVAGFNTWKDLGRYVKKGERGIAILAPVMPPKSEKIEGEEEEEDELMGPQPVYFRVVHVFDISQTEGKPLPEFEVPVLTGAANDELFTRTVTLARNQGLEVTYEPMPNQDPSIKGFYSGKTIWIKSDEPDAQQLKTLLHEMAHYYSEGVFRIPRQTAETIAESSAFVVGAHFGFDSGVRSFPYVALWAQDKKVLQANLASIRKVATVMLESLEKTPIQPEVKVAAGYGSLNFIPDSPDYLTETINQSGWREQLDTAFQEAMVRVGQKV